MFRDTTLKTSIKPKFIVGILVFSSIMILLVLSAASANAFERPPFKDALVNQWHPGSFCIPCHYTLLSTKEASVISSSCRCHNYRSSEGGFKIDLSKIPALHTSIVCIKCHVGTNKENNLTASDFHRVMSKVACLECHTFANGTYQKPQKTNCSDCHGGDPHMVHGKKLENMCVICHGDAIGKYTSTFGSTTSGAMPAFSPALTKSQAAVKEYPTIGQFISGIIQFILQIIR